MLRVVVRFFTFVFSVKVVISVILILVVAVYEQILSSTEQGFIGLLIGNQTSMFKLGGGSVIFVPKGEGGSCVFYQPRFQILDQSLGVRNSSKRITAVSYYFFITERRL